MVFVQVTSGPSCHSLMPAIAQTDISICVLIHKVFVSGPRFLVYRYAWQAHLLACKQGKPTSPSESEL